VLSVEPGFVPGFSSAKKIFSKIFVETESLCIFVPQNNNAMTQINHTEYMKKVKTMTEESLQYIITDAKEAIEAMPFGSKAGYYMDEIHYCVMEMNRRNKRKK
jgi:hypothetical protein